MQWPYIHTISPYATETFVYLQIDTDEARFFIAWSLMKEGKVNRVKHSQRYGLRNPAPKVIVYLL